MAVALTGVLAAIALHSGSLVPYPESHPDHVAVLVQENLPILDVNWSPTYYDLTIAQLVQLSSASVAEAGARDSNPTLIVWPESPAPFFTSDTKFQRWLTALAQDSHAYLIVGSLGVNAKARDKSEMFNSAQLVLPDGNLGVRYDKIHLVPFGEFVPFRRLLTFAESLTHDIGEFSRGNQRNVLPVDGHRVGTFICYESIFPDEVRRFAQNGAEVFVNISNDGWFGEWGAPGQHLNMARMRAIENGRWLLRATNNGITASASPFGEVVRASARNHRTVLLAPYAFESRTTSYTRHGDWFAHTCAIISILALLIAALSGRVPHWLSQ